MKPRSTDRHSIVKMQTEPSPKAELARMTKEHKPMWRGLRPSRRRKLFESTKGHCWYCGAPADTVDHVIPIRPRPETKRKLLSMGIAPVTCSRNRLNNLLPACIDCNHFKENFTLEEWRKKLAEITFSPYFFFWGETKEGVKVCNQDLIKSSSLMLR